MHLGDGRSFSISSLSGESDDLELPHQQFPFAGKFGRRQTGTAILSEEGELVGAIAFSPDRTDETTCRIRYLAVRRDRQQEGIATDLVATFTDWAVDGEFERVCIAADTPYAAVAVARAGFAYTGEVAPRGEVVFCYPGDGDTHLESALSRLLERSLPTAQERFIRARFES